MMGSSFFKDFKRGKGSCQMLTSACADSHLARCFPGQHPCWPWHNIPANRFAALTGMSGAIGYPFFHLFHSTSARAGADGNQDVTGAGTSPTSYGYDAMDRV